jgi:cellulose synthase/poly-beta-1,6-N-acetylglucosamine synthase-like glycosyltransferase
MIAIIVPAHNEQAVISSCIESLLAADVVSILDGTMGKAETRAAKGLVRRARQVKFYRNPLPGQTVESKSGNNKLLGAWKAQFGHEEVES